MVRPTHTEAIMYVATLFSSPSWEGMGDVLITETEDCGLAEEESVDVTFTYNNGEETGKMTVWVEGPDTLYGEW